MCFICLLLQWKNLILSQWQDAQWNADDHLPTLNQYLKNALNSSYVPVVTLYPMLLIDTSLPDDILERIQKFEYDTGMGCRLIDDYQDFKVSTNQTWSNVSYYP